MTTKFFGSVALFALTLLVSVPAIAQQRQQPPRVKSPEVLADGKVAFRIYAPKAESVRVNAGDMGVSRENSMLAKATNDIWEVIVGPIKSGAYRYSFNVDGVTVIDPRNPSTSEANDNTFSFIYIPGAEFMDTQAVPHGALAEVTYFSKVLSRFRRMHVYTPPGYENGSGKYPVFYLLHGATDSDDSWSTVGRANNILDNLIAAKKAKPMIMVMPHGHTGPFSFGRGFGEEFEKEFVSDIMPHIEKTYRVHDGQNNRALAGLSMGGAQTLNIAISNLDKFSYLGVYSSGIFSLGRQDSNAPSWEERNKEALTNENAKKGIKLFWMATGKDDFLLKVSQDTSELLKKHNFDVQYKETAGAHTWVVWREYLNEFAPLLFK